MTRIDSDFVSAGTRCAAWLYLPDDRARAKSSVHPPIVVMAHGLGGQREMRLPGFAERFAARGLAVLLFDYRCFGASDGEPRNLIDPYRHIEDWLAAVEHARALSEVDGGRLALWGTSFSGGHVLAVGSRLKGIAAIVAQVPFVGVDANADSPPLRQAGYALFAGCMDLLRKAVGAAPYYVPIIGPPERFAFLNTPDAMEAYRTLIPPDSSWQNRAPARVMFQVRGYRPVENAGAIEAPVLLVAAEDDSVIPIASVQAAAQQIPICELVVLPATKHFEPYTGDVFESVAEREATFLADRLLG